MLEIVCPHCDNKIEVIKVTVQDSLMGQNKKGHDILYQPLNTQNMTHIDWNNMPQCKRDNYFVLEVDYKWIVISKKE